MIRVVVISVLLMVQQRHAMQEDSVILHQKIPRMEVKDFHNFDVSVFGNLNKNVYKEDMSLGLLQERSVFGSTPDNMKRLDLPTQRSYENKIGYLENEIKRLKVIEEDYQNLINLNNDLKNEISEAERVRREQDRSVQLKDKEIEELKKVIEGSVKESQELTAKLDGKEIELNTLKEERNELKRKNSGLSVKLTQAKDDLKDLSMRNKRQRNMQEFVEEELESVQQSLEQSEKQNKQLNERIEEMIEENKLLTKNSIKRNKQQGKGKILIKQVSSYKPTKRAYLTHRPNTRLSNRILSKPPKPDTNPQLTYSTRRPFSYRKSRSFYKPNSMIGSSK